MDRREREWMKWRREGLEREEEGRVVLREEERKKREKEREGRDEIEGRKERE